MRGARWRGRRRLAAVAAAACLAVPLGSRFNPAEHQITPANVGGLKLKWAFAYPQQAGTPRRAGSRPSGVARYAPSGGGVWSTPAVDPVTRTLYVGTGQNYTGSGGHFDSLSSNLPGRGGALSGGGGAVVSHGLLYTQTGYAFTPYPNDRGSALMVFGR
jgi:hypothetical protein